VHCLGIRTVDPMNLTATHLGLGDSPKEASNEMQRRTSLHSYRTSRRLCGGCGVALALLYAAGLGSTRHSGTSFARIARSLSAAGTRPGRGSRGCQAIGVAANLVPSLSQQPANVVPLRRLIGRIVRCAAHSFPAPCSRPVLQHPSFRFQQEILRSLCALGLSLARMDQSEIFFFFG
jgi:hypothetical protein